LGQIFQNIGVSSEMSDVSVEMKDPGLYCEIFEIMFPFLSDQIKEIVELPNEQDEDKMQNLIDLLS